MALVSFIRIIKFAFQSFSRNIWLSVVTVVILVLTLFLISLSSSLSVLADQASRSVRERVDVTVFFVIGAEKADMDGVQKLLTTLPQVADVDFVSADEAKQRFLERQPDLADALAELEENPLPASVRIRTDELDQYPAVADALLASPYADAIEDPRRDFEETGDVIAKLDRITSRVQQVGLIVSGIFIVIAVLVVFNAIRINIYTRREEVGIMKLVGATDSFVRGPFIIESILYALIASIFTILILLPILGIASPFLDAFFEGFDLRVSVFVNAHLFEIFGVQILIALILSVVSSMAAVGRYLRV
ncbi:MAG: FtsX-like permease family protein [Candidatus Kerfeldbacteria bacterium]|nr:FtsX-like permease family protein [Candidatus Kerfeldbacteria bacterium]